MIKNNFETSQKTLDLFPIGDKKIELSYSGEQISSDGGLLLLREVENQTGLIYGISSCITDIRDLRYVDHSITELSVPGSNDSAIKFIACCN